MRIGVTIISFVLITVISFAGNKDKSQPGFKNVSGKVIDIHGNEIPGAKITVSETNETFVADLDGSFHFKVKTDKVYTIRVNSIGFQPSETRSLSLGNFSEVCLTPF